MRFDTTTRDFANGAVWHLQRGLEHYRALEVERASTFGNPSEVAQLERDTAFELSWAAGDLERAAPGIGAQDAYLGGLLLGSRDVASQLAEQLGARRYPSSPPYALQEALRSAHSAAELVNGG